MCPSSSFSPISYCTCDRSSSPLVISLQHLGTLILSFSCFFFLFFPYFVLHPRFPCHFQEPETERSENIFAWARRRQSVCLNSEQSLCNILLLLLLLFSLLHTIIIKQYDQDERRGGEEEITCIFNFTFSLISFNSSPFFLYPSKSFNNNSGWGNVPSLSSVLLSKWKNGRKNLSDPIRNMFSTFLVSMKRTFYRVNEGNKGEWGIHSGQLAGIRTKKPRKEELLGTDFKWIFLHVFSCAGRRKDIKCYLSFWNEDREWKGQERGKTFLFGTSFPFKPTVTEHEDRFDIFPTVDIIPTRKAGRDILFVLLPFTIFSFSLLLDSLTFISLCV